MGVEMTIRYCAICGRTTSNEECHAGHERIPTLERPLGTWEPVPCICQTREIEEPCPRHGFTDAGL